MSFLNASLLPWLLPVLAVPLLIHLLNKKFPKVVRFSSIELIQKAMAQRSRWFRLRHLLLAALRTLALLLLLLMFLKPVREMFGSHARRHGRRCAVILFDHSLSMEAKDNGVSARKRGVIEIEKIINTLAADDRVNVVAVERTPSACFPELAPNQTEALNFVYNLPPGLGGADFSKAGALAAEMLARENTDAKEIYFVSDFQRPSWATADLAKLPGDARAFFVNVAPEVRSNRAILDARLEGSGNAQPGETLSVEVTVGNFSPTAFQGKVEALLDGRAGFETDGSIAPWTTARLKLPLRLPTPGLHTLELRLPDDENDGLPQDNRWFLTVNATEKENVLVASDETGDRKHAAFFLGKALDPFEGTGGSVRAKHVSSVQLTGAELAGISKVFLTSLDALGPEACQRLAGFVNHGGNVVYFLDGAHDAENLAALDKAAGEALAPLRLDARQTGQNIPGGAQKILRGDFKSKYLRVFRGTQRANLALLEFYEYNHATATDHGKALLSYTDGSPALAVSHLGLGTLLLCNFSVNELASNMARQRAFPAWIQDLVKTLGEEDAGPRGHEVGEEVQDEVWKTEMPDNSVVAPSGQAVRTNRDLDVNRYRISFSAREQGVYKLAEGSTNYAWAVNCPAEESDLRSVDADTLPRRMAHEEQAHFVEGQRDYLMLSSGRPLFHLFAFAVLALLAVELGLFRLFKRRPA